MSHPLKSLQENAANAGKYLADRGKITPADLKAALAAFELAKRRAAKCAAAQYKLNALHQQRGAEHGAAKDAYERLRDAYVREVIANA